MKLYTVHAPPASTGGAADPLALVFVKEGFCWPALFLPIIWVLARRLWLVFVLYMVVVAGLAIAGNRFDGPAIAAASVLFAFLFALEANELRRWTLARKGFRLIGVAEGRNQIEAELRFFADWATEEATPPPASPPPAPVRMPPAVHGEEVIGVFPAPGGAA